MMGDPYEDRPASHAVHHATGEGQLCACHGKTEGEIAAPYAAFVFGLVVAVVLLLIIVAVAA